MEAWASGDVLIGLEAVLGSGEEPEDFRWLFSDQASRGLITVSTAAMETADGDL